MRVLMFGWEFPPHITGGLGTACYGLTRALARSGVDVIFVVPRAFGDEDQSYVRLSNASDVAVSYAKWLGCTDLMERLQFVGVGSGLLPYVSEADYRAFVEGGGAAVEATSRGDVWANRYEFRGGYGADLMQEVARYALVGGQIAQDLRGQFDVVHAHDWLTYDAGIAASEVSGCPLVVHIHATEFDRSGNNINQAVYDIERRGMQHAGRVCAVSDLTAGICSQRYGVDSAKITTVHNGVLDADLEPDLPSTQQRKQRMFGADKVVTFLGRVTFQKGPEYFVEAAAKVLQVDKNVRFVMAGSGDMIPRITRRVAELGIANRFHFAGFLKGDDVGQMLDMSDVYVMPSVSEPFGISPLEAMQHGVPCIISNQSGVAEVLRGVIKVDYWDTQAMANAIFGLLNYQELEVELGGKSAQAEVGGVSWDTAAQVLGGVYRGVVGV